MAAFLQVGPQDAPSDAKKSLLERIGKFPCDIGIGVSAAGRAGVHETVAAAGRGGGPGAGFSLYLAHIEKDILETWCIYCVMSLAAISLITLLSVLRW